MTTLIVRLPEEQKAALQLLAKSRNVSVAKITRKAIDEYVSKIAGSRGNLLLKLAKVGQGQKIKAAPKDLSRNYKQYLYGKTTG